MGKKKQPVAEYIPDLQKRPKHIEPYIDEKRVFWSFSIYDPDLRYPNESHKTISFHRIATAIKYCESRTWVDIEANHKRDHPINIDQLEKFARDRLEELQLNDFEVLLSLHFNGRCRLWGIRNQTLFQVLWLDPDHLICVSHKKHT